ncbi:MAG: flippase [Candidatus Omnitrophica bacterium]|nr:flippase [Candidatus Omnitrophota bacterium]
MNRLRLIIKNTAGFLGSLIFNRFLNFLVTIILVRYLGPKNLGQYTFVLTFAGLFALFCDLGIGQLVTREVSQDRTRAGSFLGNYLSLQLLLSSVVVVVMVIVINHFQYPHIIRLALYITGLNLLVVSLAQPFFNIAIAFEKLRFTAIASIIGNIFYCLSLLAAVFFRKGLLILVSVSLVTSILEFFLVAFICSRFCVKPIFKFNKLLWLTVARFFLPFALYIVFTGLYRRIDIVMLSRMKTDIAVGFYGAAYKIIYLFILIPTSFSRAVFPLLSQQAAEDRIKLSQTVSWSMKYLLALGFPIAIIGSFFCREIILLLFGPEFLNSAVVLNILIWVLVLVFWHSILSQALIAIKNMLAVVSGTIIAFILNVGLNFLLIPKYSYVGAAATTVFSELFIGLWFYLSLRKILPLKYSLYDFLKIVIASLIMILLFQLTYQFYFLIVITLGIVFYIIALYLLHFIGRGERVLLKEAFARKDGLFKRDAI